MEKKKPKKRIPSSEHLTQLAKVIDSTMVLYNKYKDTDATYASILETNLHVIVITSEFRALIDKIDTSKNVYERRLYARMLAVLIIEYLKDANHFIGKNLIKSGSPIVGPFVDELKSITRELALIKRDHETLLHDIRNEASAHRSKDLKKLITLLTTIDYTLIKKIAISVTKVNEKYITFM